MHPCKPVFQNLTDPHRTLELFSGKATISEMFRCAGFATTTLDIRSRRGIVSPDLHCDLRHWDYSLISPGYFSVIWASPVCTAFSIQSGNNYFDQGKFKANAQPYIDLLDTTIQLIRYLRPLFWFIENPRGRIVECESYRSLMRSHGVYLHLLTYASYGDYAPKPTYLLTNSSYVPRPCVKVGRHSKYSVTVKSLTSNQRSLIPMELAADIAVYCKNYLDGVE